MAHSLRARLRGGPLWLHGLKSVATSRPDARWQSEHQRWQAEDQHQGHGGRLESEAHVEVKPRRPTDRPEPRLFSRTVIATRHSHACVTAGQAKHPQLFLGILLVSTPHERQDGGLHSTHTHAWNANSSSLGVFPKWLCCSHRPRSPCSSRRCLDRQYHFAARDVPPTTKPSAIMRSRTF